MGRLLLLDEDSGIQGCGDVLCALISAPGVPQEHPGGGGESWYNEQWTPKKTEGVGLGRGWDHNEKIGPDENKNKKPETNYSWVPRADLL